LIDATELGAWLRLLLAPGLGREGARRLLATFGSPSAVLAADEAALRQVLSAKPVEALRQTPESWAEALKSSLAWLEGGGDERHLLVLGDAAYPTALLESPDPPLLLYVQGRLTALSPPAVAVVGSRRPTAQGRDNARAFARELATAGLGVVSGLALGIDGAAHEGALDAGGRTLAVIGTGIDRVYPPQHQALAQRIVAEGGALVSEFTPGTPPLAHNFPRRNRIIAGLSQGTLIVEAALQSGSLITARLANEAGREVFAIPGSIHSAQSRGCHALIRDGAQLVESAAEIVATLGQPLLPGLRLAPEAAAREREADAGDDGDDGDRHGLLAALGQDPVSLDSLQARTGLPTAHLLAQLLELELAGRVAHLPGGLYQRRGLG
jgi:DNA processing protein